MSTSYLRIARDGLWDHNIVLAQSLALCPLLAVTATAANGLGLGLATTAVMAASGTIISLLRKIIAPEVRIPIFVLIIGVLVTLVDLAANAWVHELHKVLGLFIPLIVTNCAILGRAESFASRNSPPRAFFDGLSMGAGFTAALVALGAAREISGSGTLFAGAALLLGEPFRFLELTLIDEYGGFLLAILPPGGFILLGIMLAAKRGLERKLERKRSPRISQSIAA